MASARVTSGFTAKDVRKSDHKTAETSAAIPFQPFRSRYGKADDAKILRVAILGPDQNAAKVANSCVHLCFRMLSKTVGATTLEMALARAKSEYAESVSRLKEQAQGKTPVPQSVEATETNGARKSDFLAPKEAFEQFYNDPETWNLKEGGEADWEKEAVCMPFETDESDAPTIYKVFKRLILQRWSKPCCRKLLLTVGGVEGHTIVVLWQNGRMFFFDTLSHGGFRGDSGKIVQKNKAVCIAAESVAELEIVLEYYLADRRGWSKSGLQGEEVQNLVRDAAQTGKGMYTSYHIDLSFYTGVEEGFWSQQDPQTLSEERSKENTSEEEQSEETVSNAPTGDCVAAGGFVERPRSREKQLAIEETIEGNLETHDRSPETDGPPLAEGLESLTRGVQERLLDGPAGATSVKGQLAASLSVERQGLMKTKPSLGREPTQNTAGSKAAEMVSLSIPVAAGIGIDPLLKTEIEQFCRRQEEDHKAAIDKMREDFSRSLQRLQDRDDRAQQELCETRAKLDRATKYVQSWRDSVVKTEGRLESHETSGKDSSDSERAHLEEERLKLQQQKEGIEQAKVALKNQFAEEKKKIDEQMKKVIELERETREQLVRGQEALKAATQEREQAIRNLETRMRREMEERAAKEGEAERARLAAEKEVEAVNRKMQEAFAISAEEKKQMAGQINAAKEELREKERETQRLVEALKQAKGQNQELWAELRSLVHDKPTCEEEESAKLGANAVSRTPGGWEEAEWSARAPNEDQKPRAGPEYSSLGPEMDMRDDGAHKELSEVDGRLRMPLMRTHVGGAADGPEAQRASCSADSARGDDDQVSSRRASLSADRSSSGGRLLARCKSPPKRKRITPKVLTGSRQKRRRRMKWETFWQERVQTLSASFRCLHRSRQRDDVSKCQHKHCEKERGRARTFCDACNAAFCTWNQAQCWVDHHQELLAKYLEKEEIKAREDFDAAAAAARGE